MKPATAREILSAWESLYWGEDSLSKERLPAKTHETLKWLYHQASLAVTVDEYKATDRGTI